MSIASITRRSLTEEILRIEEKAQYITQLKNEAIQNLLEQKEAILQGIPGIKTTPSQIDTKMAKIEIQHAEYLDKFNTKHPVIEEYQKAVEELKEKLLELDNELKIIQERHNNVMQQLKTKKVFLQERLASIEKLDLVITDLQMIMNRNEENFQNDRSSLLEKRRESLKRSDLTPSEMESMISDIDKDVEEMEREHEIEKNKLATEMLNVQNKMTSNVEVLKKRCDELNEEKMRLEEAKLNANEDELLEIEKQLKLLNTQIEECRQMSDIAALSTRDKLERILEMRGLHLTDSGRLRTASGTIMTLEEARRLGLLDDLDDELMRLRGLQVTESGRILTGSGHLYTRSEAERLGLFTQFTLENVFADESESSDETSSSSASTLSGLSSDDVHYLKAILGKPLTFALAEITAKQPRDPIHYLGHWLYKYRYNQEIDEVRKKELQEIMAERDRLAIEALRKAAEEEAKATLIDLLARVDVEIDRIAIAKELERIEAETAMMEAENMELAEEAKDVLGEYNGPKTGVQT